MTNFQWNQLVIENGGEFLQSFEWGEFQKALGKRVERIATPYFLAQIIFQPLPFGLNYGYIPRGPVIVRDTIREENFWDAFGKIRDTRTVFLEFDLSSEVPFLKPAQAITRQPQQTLLVDLTQNPNQLFGSFHKRHQVNIRRAEKNNLVAERENGWEPFYKLMSKTARRQGFRIWPRQYFAQLWETLAPAGMLEIWSAYQGSKLLAANLYILFAGRAAYLYGASSYENRSLMAPHLLHWRVIQEFQKRGFTRYDFWGLDERRFPGVTAFKKKFGGSVQTYPGSYVMVLRPNWYKLYRLVRQWKR